MKSTFFGVVSLSVVLAASVLTGTAGANWSEDFSGPLTNWDVYTFDPFEQYGLPIITTEVADGKLVFDAALPFPNDTPSENNMAAGYSALILNDPAFPDAEDMEITCVIELDGTTEQLYAGVLARAQGIQDNPSEILIDGSAYAYLISGYNQGDNRAEAGLYRLQDNSDNGLQYVRMDASYDTRVEEEPIYVKMKVTTNGEGYPHIEALMSFNADFSDPFGEIDYVDMEAGYITGVGKVGLIGFNDFEPLPAEPAGATFDDLVIITSFLQAGDANGDGFVNSTDLDIVRGNWGTSVTPGDASMGDLSGDGMVNSADLDLVRGNWGNSYAASAVPEPSVCILAALGLMVLGFRLKRQ